MITITHSRAEGTLATGTVRGDGSVEILKAWPANFRWFRSLNCWGIPNTRDKQAKTWNIERVVENLRAAGFEVTVTIDDQTPGRTVAEIEADRADRAAARVERHGELAGKRLAESDAARAASDRATEGIPMGQPILVGHHSEGRHRRALARAHNQMGKSIELRDKAKHHAYAADAAEANQRFRESVPATLRRIERLEADERGLLRQLEQHPNSEYCRRQLSEVRERLDYWRGKVAEAEEAGVKLWSRADFQRGDWVRSRDGWDLVERVNPKTLSLPTAPGWTQRKLHYSEVLERRGPEEMEAARAAAKAAKQAADAEQAGQQ